jgi:hypothetical protein
MRQILIAALLTMTARADELRITVYDRANLPKHVTKDVVDDLTRIFRRSQIDIGLVAGDPAADEASLFIHTSWPSKEQEPEVACRARRDIALQIAATGPRGLNWSVLGMAQPLASTGRLNVKIFDDRVRDAALRHNRSHSVILSHAIAHEIGHVLMRDRAHARYGLMSRAWTEYEYALMRNGVMLFPGDQSQKMRTSLRGTECPEGSSP